MKKVTLLLVILFVCVVNLFAQDYTKHPGYVDFGDLDGLKDSEETVEVFIKGPLLRFISKATKHEDPDLSKLLDNLLLIKVDVFEIERNQFNSVKKIMERVSKKLSDKKWERMVRVRERGEEYVEIYSLFGKNDEMTGLVVMALEENDEAVFVNIVGRIDPSQLGKLSSKFNIPELDSVEMNHK